MLREESKNWQQSEWPGWFFEHQATTAFKGLFPLHGDVPEQHKTGLDAFNGHPLDLKTGVNANAKGRANVWSILNDKSTMDSLFAKYGQIDFLLQNGKATFGSLHAAFVTDTRNALGIRHLDRGHSGRVSRPRKDSFTPTALSYFCFSNTDWVELIAAGIVKTFNQGKQASGQAREPKYMIAFSRIVPTGQVAL